MDETWVLFMKDLSKKDSFLLLKYNRNYNSIGEKPRNKDGSFAGHHVWEYMRIQDGMKTYHHGQLYNIYRRAVEL